MSASIADVLEGRAAPHQLPPELHDLWREGFTLGARVAKSHEGSALARAEADADYWYLRARYSDAEIDAMYQAHIDAAFESGEHRWADHIDPSADWAEARKEDRNV